MIKIENPNLDKIADAYFLRVKDECLDKSIFFKLLLEVLFKSTSHDELTKSPLNGGTKKSLINLLLNSNSQISNQTSYDKVELKNCKPWVTGNKVILEQISEYYSDVNNLRDTILIKPEDSFQKDLDLKTLFKIIPGNSSIIYPFINKIIDYNAFKKYSFCVSCEINVNTCPYCNRSYIHTVIDKKKKEIIRPTFDHYYPQSEHPFLSLSFYNLIPSCYYCNSSLKTATPITPSTHLHPYLEGFNNDARFCILIAGNKPNKSDPENYSIYMQSTMKGNDPRQRKIFGNTSKEGNINLFKLNDIYMSHRDVVGELIVKCDKYSGGYADSLYNFFGILKTNKTEFYQFYFGNYLNEKDFNRRPLAKMTKDIISKELPWFK